MHRQPLLVGVVVTCLAATVAVGGQPRSSEPVDYDAIYKIKEEGFQRSQVMDVMSYLTDIHGPRLTGSPNYKAAAEYAKKKLTEWGLTNAKFDTWGPFGRGWTNERFYAHALTPQAYPLIGYPAAWTPGTNGFVTGETIFADIQTDADLEKFKGKLKGKFVLTAPAREVRAQFDAPGRRFTDTELEELARQPEFAQRTAPPPPPGQQQGRAGGPGPGGPGAAQAFARKRTAFFVSEGVLGLLQPGRGDGGTVFVGGGGSRNADDPPVPPQVALAVEHYNRIFRTLEKNMPVTLEMNIQNKFHTEDLNGFNVLADIPGTDKSDEVVMLGAHFDSWHSGTGATDNAAGSAVMMEAVRILQAAGLKPRRTVRIGLWGGEEQGLMGSRAYVRQQFAELPPTPGGGRGGRGGGQADPAAPGQQPQAAAATPAQPGAQPPAQAAGRGQGAQTATGTIKPAHAKFSGYFNVDNGTGAIRGVYLQGNEAVAPIFSAWMEPFKNLGMTTLTIRNTGGTDHQAFDAVGLPGFQFIQDRVEYESRTHHSNMDVYDRIQARDMMHNAVVVAAFVYHTAMRDQKLPRKPLPRTLQPPPKTTTTSQGAN